MTRHTCSKTKIRQQQDKQNDKVLPALETYEALGMLAAASAMDCQSVCGCCTGVVPGGKLHNQNGAVDMHFLIHIYFGSIGKKHNLLIVIQNLLLKALYKSIYI